MEDTRIVRGRRLPEKQALARKMRRDMTPAEAALWDCLRCSRLGGLHFRRQQVIAGFIADFFCHQARLIVECDGEAHEGCEEYDRERDRVLAAYGLRVLRVTNKRVLSDMPAVLNEILIYAT
jgi:very-short-patch-repair endonuclease